LDHRPHIVVVEDEATQRQLLCDYLDKQNFRVSSADGGVALRRLVERELPSLVLLDVGLPGEDGFVLARWLRERSGRIGIIMVTAASDTVDRVVGLETGADDYIGKPYEPRELLARIKSVLRRVKAAPAAAGQAAPAAAPEGRSLKFGSLLLDLDARRLTDASGGPIELTAMEFDLLQALATRPNRVLSRGQLQEFAHGRTVDESDRSIDIRVTRLRKKIEPDPEHPRFIKTVRGEGYVFVPGGG
jgi:DNA-binding response OmpR family regulator